jgi:pseudouridine-5'-monophosphatase
LSDTVSVGPAENSGIKFAILARIQTTKDERDEIIENGRTVFLHGANDLTLESYSLPPFNYRQVTHVIFDVDGLLLDTVGMYGEALRKVLKRHGKKPSWEFRMSIMGMRREESLTKIIEFYSLPYSAEQLSDEFTRLTKKKFPHADMMEGAERLVNHLHRHGIPMAVATSSMQESYEAKTVNHKEIFSKFHHIATGSHPDIECGKPAPDIFRICCSLFEDNVTPDQCLVFEDAPNGVEAALAAGMQVVMVPDKRIPPDRLREATQLLYSLAEFQPEDFGLPPFDD